MSKHTLTICLRSCYHDYLRNFCVTCIPIACQGILTCQSVVRYPVLMIFGYYYRINVQKVTTPTTPKSKPRFIKWSYPIKLWLKINYQCYYDCKKQSILIFTCAMPSHYDWNYIFNHNIVVNVISIII